jgi:hypothetical protein
MEMRIRLIRLSKFSIRMISKKDLALHGWLRAFSIQIFYYLKGVRLSRELLGGFYDLIAVLLRLR